MLLLVSAFAVAFISANVNVIVNDVVVVGGVVDVGVAVGVVAVGVVFIVVAALLNRIFLTCHVTRSG